MPIDAGGHARDRLRGPLRSAGLVLTLALVVVPAWLAAAGPTPRANAASPAGRGLELPPTLYAQDDEPSGNGVSSQRYPSEAGLAAYDAEAADDLRVPSGETWIVRQVWVAGYLPEGDPIPTVEVRFYADRDGLPGRLEHGQIVDAPGTDRQIDLGTDLALPAGRYWLAVIAVGGGDGDQWYWATSEALHGAPSAWRNPGDGFATGCTEWVARIDDCPGEPTEGIDHRFILYGTVFSQPCENIATGGPDRIVGTGRRDILCGLAGNDDLLGKGDHDRLLGGSGNDLLAGGPGIDTCVGGPGRDRERRCER
jgi:Ca2+-binding RTX toxin-like protein